MFMSATFPATRYSTRLDPHSSIVVLLHWNSKLGLSLGNPRLFLNLDLEVAQTIDLSLARHTIHDKAWVRL